MRGGDMLPHPGIGVGTKAQGSAWITGPFGVPEWMIGTKHEAWLKSPFGETAYPLIVIEAPGERWRCLERSFVGAH